jgi:hypothetical protein
MESMEKWKDNTKLLEKVSGKNLTEDIGVDGLKNYKTI